MPQPTPALVPTNSEKYELAAQAPGALARILSRVVYIDGCWIWRGAVSTGYAVATFNRQSVYVHRLAHWLVHGPIPDGYVLDHVCRTPACVNPMHTEVVTTAENTRRGEGNGSQTDCPARHPYSPENTRLINGRRYCITCQNARNRARYPKSPSREAGLAS